MKYIKRFPNCTYKTTPKENGSSNKNTLYDPTRIVCKYSVPPTRGVIEALLLCESIPGGGGYGGSGLDDEPYTPLDIFSEMEVDGNVSEVTSRYTFETPGEHIVKYTLSDPTDFGTVFSKIQALTEIYIPEGVTFISDKAFYLCVNLVSISIPSTIYHIGGSAFFDAKVSNIYITDLSAWCNIDFEDTPFLYLPYGEANTNHLYLNGKEIKKLVIPNDITVLDDYAFFECNSITSVVIPEGVTFIGDYAFYNCLSLTSVIIPSTVTTIEGDAFGKCNLSSITCLATTAPSIYNTTFYDVQQNNGVLTVPAGSTGYDVWMGTGDYYLGKYDWTKVEQ